MLVRSRSTRFLSRGWGEYVAAPSCALASDLCGIYGNLAKTLFAGSSLARAHPSSTWTLIITPGVKRRHVAEVVPRREWRGAAAQVQAICAPPAAHSRSRAQVNQELFGGYSNRPIQPQAVPRVAQATQVQEGRLYGLADILYQAAHACTVVHSPRAYTRSYTQWLAYFALFRHARDAAIRDDRLNANSELRGCKYSAIMPACIVDRERLYLGILYYHTLPGIIGPEFAVAVASTRT